MILGFVGLGNLGLPMAINLVNSGYKVYGLNRSKQAEEILLEKGGNIGLSLKELGQKVDVLMTCLPLPQDVDKVLLGEDGVVENGKPGLTIIDFSTVSPDLNQRVYDAAAKKGISFLDAPISGGNEGAKFGTLSIMVGGDKEVFDRVAPIFDVLGKNVFYTGKVGNGTIIKLINQYMVCMHTQAVSEALTLAGKLGIDFETLFPILNTSYANSKIYERHYQQHIAKNEFGPGFALQLLHKDMSLVQKMANENDVKLLVGDKVEKLLAEAKESIYKELDMSAMYLFMKEKMLEN